MGPPSRIWLTDWRIVSEFHPIPAVPVGTGMAFLGVLQFKAQDTSKIYVVGGKMSPEPKPRLHENLLLSALPKAERERLNPFLHRMHLEAGHPITSPDEPIENLYFPFGAVTSTVQEMSDGSSIETGLMGIEGVAGVQVWLGQRSTAATTFVQIPGEAYRMSTDDFIREVREKPSPLNPLVAKYIHAFLIMTSFTAACNRLHSVDERLCRWLRMSYNRADRSEFPLRQEFLAQMLGVQRPTLSTAASMLQRAGLITYKYGRLKITDPEGLIDGACECYTLMEIEFEKIFDQNWLDIAEIRERVPQ
jgi:CRP-like cAMP-binding protein